jgi:hypothetical protein
LVLKETIAMNNPLSAGRGFNSELLVCFNRRIPIEPNDAVIVVLCKLIP